MIINNKGKIIVIGSLASFLSFKFLGVYSATKASLNSIIISLQKELNLINSKVRVILVEPGMYHSGFNQVMLENKFDIMNNGFFKDEINLIRKKENFLFSLIEKREFDSIVCAIICAIKYDSILVYRAPLFQSLFAKIYNFFRS
jgi:short-subunit dehydrogenase